ncbi:MAG: Rieske 2Fe-2S domain-containing protein, partial [Ilumatobacteraceae bacterium]
MTMTPDAPGAARSPGATYQDLLDDDSRPENVPVVLRWTSNEFLGSADIPRSRYVSREFHELEKDKMWKKTWQMACREEDIPDVGDTLVYDICDLSILLVRSAPDRIQAYYNACLHRGRQLKEHDSNNTELRCAFHGYCWNLDG